MHRFIIVSLVLVVCAFLPMGCSVAGIPIGGRPSEPSAPATAATPQTLPITTTAPTIVPIFIDVGADTAVDPAWYPCREGQIKGNTQSNQFYLPATDRYAFTYKTVVCFDAPAAAEAAGFRLAHR